MSKLTFLNAEEQAAIIDLVAERMPGRRFMIVTVFNEEVDADDITSDEVDVFGTMSFEAVRQYAQVALDMADDGSPKAQGVTPRGRLYYG